MNQGALLPWRQDDTDWMRCWTVLGVGGIKQKVQSKQWW